MPYKFQQTVFKNNVPHIRMWPQCGQCEHTMTNGVKCKRDLHVATILLAARVKSSGESWGFDTAWGTGLFADRDFEEYEMIVPYGGETLSQKEQIKRYATPKILLQPYLLHSTDAACKHYIGSATNGSLESCLPNTKMQNFQPHIV